MKELNNEQYVQLAYDLAKSEKEIDVIDALNKHGLWDDDSCWRDYGDIENNFSSIGNQMESADTALTEKLINCADSMLMVACNEAGINPESEDAPASIGEALKLFYEVPEGMISYLSESERTELAAYIGLVATGGKTRPSYTIFDIGLGQSPSQFSDTFMSLNASNKIRIPFVQGKFNMGSTGALPFCGDYNLQLIVSRKRPSVVGGLSDGAKWGLTVVRRYPPTGQMKSSIYRYLAPSNGEVISFEAEPLKILPRNGVYDDAYVEGLPHGTFVKLYEYDIGPGLRTNILLDLYNRLNLLLPRMYLPIRLYERRPGYDAHSYETTLSGLSIRVDLDRNENLEPYFPTSATISFQGVELYIDIFAFKKKGKGSAKDKYAKNEGVVFSLNGQAHGFLGREFFSRGRCGMDYLSKSLLVHIDCSGINGDMKEKLFMNSRDRLRNGKLKKVIESKLESIIYNHEGLRDLREKRKRESIAEQISDDKPLAEILESVLKGSKALSDLLLRGKRITNPFYTGKHKEKEEYEGKQFPTFYEPIHPHPKEKPRVAELGRSVHLQFMTDAENQYFRRDIEPGTIQVECDDIDELAWDDNLWNGKHNISIDLPKSVSVGQELVVIVSVNDDSRPELFLHEVYLEVVPMHKKNGGGKKPNKPASDNKGDDVNDQGGLGLPNVYPVPEEKWDDHDFDKYSGLRVVQNGEDGYDYFYNQDNAYLRNEQKVAKDQVAKVLETQFKSALVLIGMSMMTDSDLPEEERPDQIALATRTLSPVVLPMINGLGALEAE